MRTALTLTLGLLLALANGAAAAQQVEPIDDLQWLVIEDTVGTLFATNAEARTAALEVMAQARTELLAGRLGEARRGYAQARVQLAGEQWDAAAAFVASLAMRPAHVAIDPDRPLLLEIGQHFVAVPPTAQPLQLRLFARRWQRRPAPDLEGALALAEFDLATPDLVEAPQHVLIDTVGLPDGSWELVAEVVQGEVVLGRSSARIHAARQLENDRARIAARLAALDLREGLSASIAYPLNLIDGLDTRTRRVRDVDLRALLDRSLALLESAERGNDPLWQARGTQARHYRSLASGRIEPFSLFIPESWDGTAALPLAVMLHGSMGDEASVFADGELSRLAEQAGLAVLAPLGDDPNSGWGNRLPVVLADGTMPPPRPVISDGRVTPLTALDQEPAEADLAATLAAVMAEYPIDQSRIYLGGNSMGGEGVWHFAALWPERWAAIAPGAGPVAPERYPYARLGQLPVLVVHGTDDEIISHAASEEMVTRLAAAGGRAELLAPHAGHDAFNGQLQQVISFFLRHRQTAGDMP